MLEKILNKEVITDVLIKDTELKSIITMIVENQGYRLILTIPNLNKCYTFKLSIVNNIILGCRLYYNGVFIDNILYDKDSSMYKTAESGSYSSFFESIRCIIYFDSFADNGVLDTFIPSEYLLK